MQKHMHSGATVHTGLSVRFLINSLSPTFSIFLAFILYSHLYINLYTLYIISYISYILYFSCIYLFYLFFPILRYLHTSLVCSPPSAVPVELQIFRIRPSRTAPSQDTRSTYPTDHIDRFLA